MFFYIHHACIQYNLLCIVATCPSFCLECLHRVLQRVNFCLSEAAKHVSALMGMLGGRRREQHKGKRWGGAERGGEKYRKGIEGDGREGGRGLMEGEIAVRRGTREGGRAGDE